MQKEKRTIFFVTRAVLGFQQERCRWRWLPLYSRAASCGRCGMCTHVACSSCRAGVCFLPWDSHLKSGEGLALQYMVSPWITDPGDIVECPGTSANSSGLWLLACLPACHTSRHTSKSACPRSDSAASPHHIPPCRQAFCCHLLLPFLSLSCCPGGRVGDRKKQNASPMSPGRAVPRDFQGGWPVTPVLRK